jgi:hypothetical protein
MEGASRFNQAVHKGVVDRLHHHDAGAGGTLLTAVAKGGVDHPLHGLIQVGAFVDDDAVFAAHFSNHPLQVLLAGAPAGRRRHRCGSPRPESR